MISENVERWGALIEEIRAGSADSGWEPWLASLAEIVDPGIEWDASEVPMPGLSGVRRGKEAMVQWWREWLEAWETIDLDYELLEAGERVVLLVAQRMRGRFTNIEVDVGKYAQVATFNQGLIVHGKIYASQSKALEAAGLRE